MGIRMETKSFKNPEVELTNVSFIGKLANILNLEPMFKIYSLFSTKSCNYSRLQESCFIFPTCHHLAHNILHKKKKKLHFVSITIIVFLHTFFGLAQFFKKPCNPVFNVLQFFQKKKWGTLPPLVKWVYIWFDNRCGVCNIFS